MSKPTAFETASESPKAEYRVTNWSAYDGALVRRGEVTVWFDEDFLRHPWHGRSTGKRGAPWKYSETAIQTLVVLKAVFGLPYWALEGFTRSLMTLMKLDFPVPDHTQMSRRARRLQVAIPRRERPGPIHLMVDSRGLKIYGISEWKVRQHEISKRRTWRKVHLAVDGNEKDVIGVEVTTVEWSDGEVFGGLVEQVEGEIEKIDADGAYDTREAYAVAAERGARLVAPPRDNAIPWEAGHPRNDALESIAEQSRAEWKQATGYHRRSLAENAMYRLKQLFGDSLASRLFEKALVLLSRDNRVTHCGATISVVRSPVCSFVAATGFPGNSCVISTANDTRAFEKPR